jgi:hypothetical protein
MLIIKFILVRMIIIQITLMLMMIKLISTARKRMTLKIYNNTTNTNKIYKINNH